MKQDRDRRKEVKGIVTLILWPTRDALFFEMMEGDGRIAHGRCSRIGRVDAFFEVTTDSEPYAEAHAHSDHRQALRTVIDYLQRNGHITALRDITAVIHRVPNGGSLFLGSTLLTREELERLRTIAHLSPDLPACITTIAAAHSQLAGAAHIGVFDTACTGRMPQEAVHYAMAPLLSDRFRLRRYGADGIMHQAAFDKGMLLLRKRDTPRHPPAQVSGHASSCRVVPRRVVTVIIDDDVSATAFLVGMACETTTGFTAAEGLPGLHRTGSLDPRIPLHLAAHLKATPQQIDTLLSRRSGIAGMTGRPSYEEIFQGARKWDPACVNALMLLSYRIAQAVASMTAALGGLDALVFAGKGASWMIEEEVCGRLSYLGIRTRVPLRSSRGPSSRGFSSSVLSSPSSTVVVVQLDITIEQALLAEASKVLAKTGERAAADERIASVKSAVSAKARTARNARRRHRPEKASAHRSRRPGKI